MLTELAVRNLAVVESLTAIFRPGLNAITGETGAGKSLVVSSLDLVLGGRASADLVRQGAAEADVTARFELDPAKFPDLPVEEGALLLRRVVGIDGRSRAYVNDRPVAVGTLHAIGARLADIHGQHEQQSLRREETHLDVLDAFAGAREAAARVAERYRVHAEALATQDAFLAAARTGAEERDFLRQRLAELDEAALESGEEERLQAERHRAAHGERLADLADEASRALAEADASAEALLARASRALEKAAALDPALEPIRRQVDEALVLTEDAAREAARYRNGLDVDPARLEAVEARLARLADLRRRHRAATIEELLEGRESLRARAASWEETPERLAALEARVEAAGRALSEAASELSALRSRSAALLSRETTRELIRLGMPGAKFVATLRPPKSGRGLTGRESPVGPRGAEEAAFLLAANPGEKSGPLAAIASGGEASRVMLALKTVLRGADPVPLVVFDEVDAGIGGLVAEAVGGRLAAVARDRQVIVVTHLAVIAGKAAHHLSLRKLVERKRTRVILETLEGRDREEELARMLAGTAGGDDARRTAQALLRAATPEAP